MAARLKRGPLAARRIMPAKKLQVNLPPNWREASEEMSVDVTTFIRDDSQDSGALQVSTAWFVGGAVPNPNPSDLIDLARNVILKQGDVSDIEDGYVDDCAIGTFGSVIARLAGNRVQVWCMSNGYDFVLATHTAALEPEAAELEEAEAIVRGMCVQNAGPSKPWWKLWSAVG